MKMNEVSFSGAKSKLPKFLMLAALAVPSVAMAADEETTKHKEGEHAIPASAHAVTANVGFTTDYIFRGISQSQHKPAVSGGVDYSHASGLYAGVWVSTQQWVKTGGTDAANDPYKTSSDLEVDFYGGYKGAVGEVGYDIGAVRYYYTGDKVATQVSPDTTEAYLGASFKMLSVKYSHAVSDYFIGWGVLNTTKTKGSNYLELNASHDLGDGWGLLGHLGNQKVKNVSTADYTDWKVGATKDVGFGTVTVAYSDTNAQGDAGQAYSWDNKNTGKGVLAISFAKSF